MLIDEWSEKQKAAHAKSLLDDPLIESFFAETKAQVFEDWCGERDMTRRQELWDRIQALELFRAYLHSFIAAGTLLTHREHTHE